VAPGLPLKWTKDKITWEGKEYDAAEHVPVLIYPSPLNTERYVVVNSGHTFHASDFVGTNALLYPRLGDHALLKLDRAKKDPLAVTVVRSGLFDDYWRVTTKPGRIAACGVALVAKPRSASQSGNQRKPRRC